MLKKKLIWLLTAGFLLFSTLTWAAPLQNYSIVYVNKNPDGTISNIIKYYLRDGNKFRADYLRGNGEWITTNILRNDKGLVWSLDQTYKTYFEVPLKPGKWENAVLGVSGAESPDLKKTGTTKFLNYTCDIYIVETEEWTNIIYLEPSMNLMLRSETKIKGETFQIREASTLSLEKPPVALFEIPAGYKHQ